MAQGAVIQAIQGRDMESRGSLTIQAKEAIVMKGEAKARSLERGAAIIMAKEEEASSMVREGAAITEGLGRVFNNFLV